MSPYCVWQPWLGNAAPLEAADSQLLPPGLDIHAACGTLSALESETCSQVEGE